MRSESIAKLAEALAKAQGAIKGALKDSDNPFFKSKYADLASVVEAIREPLSVNGLSYIQVAHDKDSAAAIETIILHSSGEWHSCGIMSVPVTKADAQGFGSAVTYCRRYSLSAAFGVAPEDDDGNDAAKNAPKKPAETPGRIVDQGLALEGMTPEVTKRLREEARKIEGDFYSIGAKAAVGSWQAFKKTASLEEETACWMLMPSTVRTNIKKCEEAMKGTPSEKRSPDTPTIADVRKLLDDGDLDAAADLARSFPEAQRITLEREIAKKIKKEASA